MSVVSAGISYRQVVVVAHCRLLELSMLEQSLAQIDRELVVHKLCIFGDSALVPAVDMHVDHKSAKR